MWMRRYVIIIRQSVTPRLSGSVTHCPARDRFLYMLLQPNRICLIKPRQRSVPLQVTQLDNSVTFGRQQNTLTAVKLHMIKPGVYRRRFHTGFRCQRFCQLPDAFRELGRFGVKQIIGKMFAEILATIRKRIRADKVSTEIVKNICWNLLSILFQSVHEVIDQIKPLRLQILYNLCEFRFMLCSSPVTLLQQIKVAGLLTDVCMRSSPPCR